MLEDLPAEGKEEAIYERNAVCWEKESLQRKLSVR
jgi:hypothetical protein